MRCVKRHLERSLGRSEIVVLNRNNSQNRLDAATPVPPGEPDRREARRLLAQLVPRRPARPDACAGDRQRAAAHLRPLQPAQPHDVRPSLVGGEVIGSVLVAHERPLSASEQGRIDQSVSQAAPVLANLRNLAVAEVRAATDALTGLPNARSLRESLVRMVAQAARSNLAALRGALRPRPLQADQRRLRAREGRPGAGRGERRAQVGAPRERSRRPLRRRGVPDPAPGHAARGRGRAGGEAAQRGRARDASPASTARSRPASASPRSPRTRRTGTCSCGWPTARSTPRRRSDATASSRRPSCWPRPRGARQPEPAWCRRARRATSARPGASRRPRGRRLPSRR